MAQSFLYIFYFYQKDCGNNKKWHMFHLWRRSLSLCLGFLSSRSSKFPSSVSLINQNFLALYLNVTVFFHNSSSVISSFLIRHFKIYIMNSNQNHMYFPTDVIQNMCILHLCYHKLSSSYLLYYCLLLKHMDTEGFLLSKSINEYSLTWETLLVLFTFSPSLAS